MEEEGRIEDKVEEEKERIEDKVEEVLTGTEAGVPDQLMEKEQEQVLTGTEAGVQDQMMKNEPEQAEIRVEKEEAHWVTNRLLEDLLEDVEAKEEVEEEPEAGAGNQEEMEIKEGEMGSGEV